MNIEDRESRNARLKEQWKAERIAKLKKLSKFNNTRYEDASLSHIDFDECDSQLLSEWIYNPKDILYIYSPPGVGKTYFCSALFNHFCEKGIYIVFYKEKDFFADLHQEMTEHRSVDFRLKSISEYDFLMFDDLGSTRSGSDGLNLTDWQKDQLFSLVDYRVDRKMPTIITSNYSPDELKSVFHERFISRIKSKDNTIIELKGNDKRKGTK